MHSSLICWQDSLRSYLLGRFDLVLFAQHGNRNGSLGEDSALLWTNGIVNFEWNKICWKLHERKSETYWVQMINKQRKGWRKWNETFSQQTPMMDALLLSKFYSNNCKSSTCRNSSTMPHTLPVITGHRISDSGKRLGQNSYYVYCRRQGKSLLES